MKRIRSLSPSAPASPRAAARRSPGWGVAAILLITVLLVGAGAASAAPSPVTDSQIFLDGLRAYQLRDYADSQVKLGEVVKRYPTSPVRDLALYWLSRSCYRSGNHRAAARYLSQLYREYPHTPLKELVDMDMQRLLNRYERGDLLPTATGTAANPDGQNAV